MKFLYQESLTALLQGVYETQDRAAEVVISTSCRLSSDSSDSCFSAKNRRVMATIR
jgi:hypothetical glycosyl hydrolase